ncbi:HNH/endonuclease VII fold toxin-2 domain-containing protein [Cellvibrio sp. NN19]
MIKEAGCANYKHSEAPTVCVEGGKDNGSHGRVHDAMDGALEKASEKGKS